MTVRFIKAQSILDTGRVSVEKHDFEHEDGRSFSKTVFTHPGACVIIPQCDDGKLLLVQQYRYPLQETILEFPAGTREGKEEPLICAKREIQEEVGEQASEWVSLGKLYPTPGLLSEVQYLYLARGLTPSSLPADEDEIIEPLRMTVPEVEEAIRSEKLLDAKSIAIFYRARLMGLL